MEFKCQKCDYEAPTMLMGLQHLEKEHPITSQSVNNKVKNHPKIM